MIVVIVIILLLVIYFDIDNDIKRPVVGGAKQHYYELLDVSETNYQIEKFDYKYAQGDLTTDYPLHPYVREGQSYNWTGKKLNIKVFKTHWGQRKLLLTEVDLFNRFNPSEKYLVVYAGAADGRHMPLLTQWYPNIVMHLYDPRPFYAGISSERILLNPFVPDADKSGWFTDEVANNYRSTSGRIKYKGENRLLVFVSDIRTNPTETEIEANQRQQEQWVRIMNPVWTMLKFKLPYPDCKAKYYKYMQGDIRLQCWAPVSSAETRLITYLDQVQRNGNYPINRYERNLSWYNSIMRTYDFRNIDAQKLYIPINYTFGEIYSPYVGNKINIGYDFVYETQIICDYLRWANKDITIENIREIIDSINERLMDAGSKFENYLKDRSYKRQKIAK